MELRLPEEDVPQSQEKRNGPSKHSIYQAKACGEGSFGDGVYYRRKPKLKNLLHRDETKGGKEKKLSAGSAGAWKKEGKRNVCTGVRRAIERQGHEGRNYLGGEGRGSLPLRGVG